MAIRPPPLLPSGAHRQRWLAVHPPRQAPSGWRRKAGHLGRLAHAERAHPPRPSVFRRRRATPFARAPPWCVQDGRSGGLWQRPRPELRVRRHPKRGGRPGRPAGTWHVRRPRPPPCAHPRPLLPIRWHRPHHLAPPSRPCHLGLRHSDARPRPRNFPSSPGPPYPRGLDGPHGGRHTHPILGVRGWAGSLGARLTHRAQPLPRPLTSAQGPPSLRRQREPGSPLRAEWQQPQQQL